MYLGLAFALGASIVWGLVYTLDQKVLLNISPGALVFWNALISLIVTMPLFLNYKSLKALASIDSGTFKLMFLAQTLALIANLLIFSSIKILGASVASVFEISYPFFVLIFSFLIFGTTFNIYFWIGAGFLAMGSAIIMNYGGLK